MLAGTPQKPDYTEKEFLHMKSIFEQLGGTYHEENRYLILDLRLPNEEEQPIGTWGMSQCQWNSSCGPSEPTGEKAASGLCEAVS